MKKMNNKERVLIIKCLVKAYSELNKDEKETCLTLIKKLLGDVNETKRNDCNL